MKCKADECVRCGSQVEARGALFCFRCAHLDSRPASAPSVDRNTDIASLRRTIHELRTYNPKADTYGGAHIHKGWANFIEAAICAAPVAQPLAPIGAAAKAIKRAIIGLRDGWATHADADTALAMADTLDTQPLAASAVPEGFALVPDYRGYANLGTGQYILNHSKKGSPAELIISVATEAEKAGRTIGDERENPPYSLLQPEAMAVRIRFSSLAGLDVLENQLRKLRAEHFAAPSQQPAASEIK